MRFFHFFFFYIRLFRVNFVSSSWCASVLEGAFGSPFEGLTTVGEADRPWICGLDKKGPLLMGPRALWLRSAVPWLRQRRTASKRFPQREEGPQLL